MNFRFILLKLKKLSTRKRKVKKIVNVQKTRKNRSQKRIKKTNTPKQRLTKDEKEGMAWGQLATGVWKLQKNPEKVYVSGKRIHHGLVGAILTLVGAVTNDDKVKGFGKVIMKDDIDDAPNWLNFEDGYNFTTGYA